MLHIPIAGVTRSTLATDPEVVFRTWPSGSGGQRAAPRAPQGGDVHVWIIPLGPCGRSSHGGERLRERAAGRELRAILSCYLGCTQRRIALACTPAGRPYLSRPSAALDFNLSHSGEWAALAIAPARLRVGIDVERITSLPDLDRLLQAICTPSERARMAALPPEERLGSFFALWTRREALTKSGLAEARLDRPVAVPGDASVVAFEPAPGYAGTVAVVRAAASVEEER
jgi:4'-phosphopantetheinyl transferase